MEFILSNFQLLTGSHTHGLNYFKALYCGMYSNLNVAMEIVYMVAMFCIVLNQPV